MATSRRPGSFGQVLGIRRQCSPLLLNPRSKCKDAMSLGTSYLRKKGAIFSATRKEEPTKLQHHYSFMELGILDKRH